MDASKKLWDAFLSYASEDKVAFAKPLAELLRYERMSIWFDEFELGLGDSITQSIERGLANSKAGIIAISKVSLNKNWTKYEISTSKTLFINYGTRLVPLWLDVDADAIRLTDPGILDIKGIDCAGKSIEEICFNIIYAIRPDIHSNLRQKLQLDRFNIKSTVSEIGLSQIKEKPSNEGATSGAPSYHD